MKKVPPTSVLIWITAIPTAILYTVFLISSFILHSGFSSYLIGITVLALTAAAILLTYRGPKWLRRIFCIGLCFYIATFLVLSTWIFVLWNRNEEMKSITDETCIFLVFGCHTNGLTPSKELASRLNVAHDMLQQNPDAICIVSGGQGKNETVSEAYAMQQYLISRGIDASRILLEDRASSTVYNLSYSYALIREKGLENLPVYAISSLYHLPRISYLDTHQDHALSGYIGASVDRLDTLLYSLVREYMAFYKSFAIH